MDERVNDNTNPKTETFPYALKNNFKHKKDKISSYTNPLPIDVNLRP